MRRNRVCPPHRISPTHHRFACTRPDGTEESFELESKSFLFHDLLHFATETEAVLNHSFYGKLAAGIPYEVLTKGMGQTDPGENVVTERVVGGLTSVVKQNVPTDAFMMAMRNMSHAHGEAMPTWLTEEFVERVKEHMRRLQGEWNALPFGETMTLEFT